MGFFKLKKGRGNYGNQNFGTIPRRTETLAKRCRTDARHKRRRVGSIGALAGSAARNRAENHRGLQPAAGLFRGGFGRCGSRRSTGAKENAAKPAGVFLQSQLCLAAFNRAPYGRYNQYSDRCAGRYGRRTGDFGKPVRVCDRSTRLSCGLFAVPLHFAKDDLLRRHI